MSGADESQLQLMAHMLEAAEADGLNDRGAAAFMRIFMRKKAAH